jgi:hypothetical protein
MMIPLKNAFLQNKIIQKWTTQLPQKLCAGKAPAICARCEQVNVVDHHFCTNCGYPVVPNQEQLTIYKVRLSYRKRLLNRCREKVVNARTILYIAAAICMLGISYFFSDSKPAMMRGLVFVITSLLFIGLAKWSTVRPFTAMLTSFLVMITIVALNTWVEFTRMFTSVSGVYLLLGQLALLYFLTQGVKAAYHADILEEEMAV